MEKQLRNLLNRVEILFWTASVSLMRNQRASRLAVAAIVVGLSGLIVVPVMLRAQAMRSAPSVPAAVQPTSLPSVDEQMVQDQPARGVNQKNLLLILVDSLGAGEPQLMGIWLVGQVNDMPQVVFLPLYPTSRPDESELFHKLFSLDAYGKPAAGLLDYLITKKVWWDHYLVADKGSLADLIALAGGLDWEGQVSGGPEVVESLPGQSAPLEMKLRAQSRVALVLCENSPQLIQNANPEIIWGLLTHRMRSDIDLEAVKALQEQISKPGGSPVCEFPTLRQPVVIQSDP